MSRSCTRSGHRGQRAYSCLVAAEGLCTNAARIQDVKGFAGGRFYVNEFRTIFAPVSEGQEWRYVYIGRLDMESWFPAPKIQPLPTQSGTEPSSGEQPSLL